VVAALASAQPAAGASRVVRSGNARFEVLTPTLVRVEYAADGQFEDRPTQTAINRDQPVPAFGVTRSLGTLTIDTGAIKLHYVEGSGPFTPANLWVDVDGGTTARPAWDACQQTGACGPAGGGPGTADAGGAIGGYTREVVSVNDQFPPLHGGLLRTSGWYLLDDTATAVRTGPTTAVARLAHVGPYQDGYFFGYGHDYARGLADFASLTGHAPLLPRWVFGPWFSRYFAYSDHDYRTSLIPAFRSHDTPLDGLSVDTDFKAPDRWNGWGWNASLFPDPAGFVSWAAGHGLHVVLNIHPSIDDTDPQFAAAQQRAHGKLATSSGDCQFYRQNPTCYVFDWGDPDQAAAYFDLHRPFNDAGVSAFWLDWCCDASTVSTAGLTPDSWVNELYAQHARARGQRGFVLSRIGSGIFAMNPALGDVDAPASGAWSDHRSAIAFTGDGTSDFPTLAFEARLTPAEGAAIGLPYVSHDIGGYSGNHLPDDLYLRWLQLGTFSPVMRLHSDHGDRLPWDYDSAAEIPAERFMRLREALVPYLYDTAEQAHRTGLPMTREMVLGWPDEQGAAAATDQWMLGDDLLVAPIASAGTTASRGVWLPPGSWTDFFTGQTVAGPGTRTVSAGLDRAPVWIRAGGIVPLAPPMSHVGARAVDPLTLRVAPGAAGRSSLYEDAGDGLGYEHGEAARTPLTYQEPAPGAGRLVIGPASGSFPGAPATRAYVVQFLASARPSSVRIDGHTVRAAPDAADPDMTHTDGAIPGKDSWSYDPAMRIVSVRVAPRRVGSSLVVDHS
jgi:Glycosyl hydrolases family 31/Domain of unknown function (DUF5110)